MYMATPRQPIYIITYPLQKSTLFFNVHTYGKNPPRSRAGIGCQAIQQHPREGIRLIQVAEICGGMLIVIAPLNSIQTRSPGQKRQAQEVWTTTS